MISIQRGDCFLLTVDRDWIEFGSLPLNSPLTELLASSEGQTLSLKNGTGEEQILTLNQEEGLLEGDNLTHLFPPSPGGQFHLQLLQTKPLTLKIIPFWSHGKNLSKGEEQLHSSGEIEDIQKTLNRLYQHYYHSEEDYHLHQQALYFTLQIGFHHLLSLPVLDNIEPFDYQIRTAYKVLQDMRGRALLSDEVGLGKTIEAGLIMMEYIMRGLAKKILILVPPSLVEQWLEEMKTKFNLDFVSYDSPRFQKEENGWEAFDRVIASLHTAKQARHRSLIQGIDYDLVIVDEAHHLKNRSTLSWKFVNHLKKKFILLLTATPVQNKLEELFNLVTLLRPGQLDTAMEFKKKYITRGEHLKPKNPHELKQFVRRVMIRNKRSSNQVLLTRRQAQTITINQSFEEKVFYQLVNDTLKNSYGKSEKGLNRMVVKTIQRQLGSSREAVVKTISNLLSQGKISPGMKEELQEILEMSAVITRNTKLESLINLLKGIDDQVILFTSFRQTQEAMARRLQEEEISFSLFHGHLRRAQKEEAINTFESGKKVLICTESGGEGRNLQFCNKMINYDLPWNPMRIEQRIGRIHRIGQKRDVYIYNLSTLDTIEAYILELLDAKINMFQLVIGELDMILGNLKDKRDFEEIILDLLLNAQNNQAFQEDMKELGEKLLTARKEYQKTMAHDKQLFGELFQDE